MSIPGLQLPVIVISKPEPHNGGFHKRCRCSYGQKIVHLFYPVHNLWCCHHKAKPPSCDRVRFRKRIADNGPLPHSRQRCHTRMDMWSINDMLIDLIRNHIEIVSDRKICNDFQFFVCKNFSARIRWIAEDKRLDTRLFHCLLQLVGIKRERRWL